MTAVRLTAPARRMLLLALVFELFVCGMFFRARLAARGAVTVASARAAAQTPERLDLNAADEAALMAIPGLGEKRAAAITAYRAAHGPFASVEELVRIDGIGTATAADLKWYLEVR